ncbi:hypothetical protein [Corynebacterium auris]|uniref:hypothetical protein n=1 Tax=Corynebacterium auris TaxID=44750 RepID=UPI0025B2D3BC|nr:hypothetical protein [Corynebacterium auris]WJY68943.1 hypothetical protein CAURIS_10350 [Corynebacterium auris]
MSRFQFVDDHHTTHGVKRLCQVLGLSRSSFYRWRAGYDARAARRDADKALVKRMREYHREFDGTIGVRRMTIELNEKADQPINLSSPEFCRGSYCCRLGRLGFRGGVFLMGLAGWAVP